MKRLTYWVVFLFCLMGGILWAVRNFADTWEPLIRRELTTRLSAALHTRVDIEDVAIAGLTKLRIDDVRVWSPVTTSTVRPLQTNPLLFRATRVDFTFSFIDLPGALIHRRPLESIGLIFFENPTIYASPQVLRHFQRRSTARSGSWPPLFTLAWKGGTLQWTDPAFGPKPLTAYQLRGLFRIRGPKTDFNLKGSIREIDQFRVQWGALGQRWNGQVSVQGLQALSLRALVEERLKRSLFPRDWTINGNLEGDITAGGRQWPPDLEHFPTLVRDGRISSDFLAIQMPGAREPLNVSGAVGLQGQRLLLKRVSVAIGRNALLLSGAVQRVFDAPTLDVHAQAHGVQLESILSALGQPMRLEGTGDLTLTAQGPARDLDVSAQASIPQGKLGGWPFSEARLSARRVHDHWEFPDSTATFWKGRLLLKGTLSDAGSELQITGEDIDLAAAPLPALLGGLQGRLHFSSVLRGPIKDWHTTGSLWLTQYTWQNSRFESVRGTFELTPDRFQAQIFSEDHAFQATANGSRTDEAISLDRFDLRLPSGATMRGEGSATGHGESAVVKANFDAQNIAVPRDTPFLEAQAPTLSGLFSFKGAVSGTLGRPQIEGEAISKNLSAGPQSLAPATASVRWVPHESLTTRFHLSPGMEGRWQLEEKPEPRWNLTLDATEAPAATLVALLPPHWPLSGSLSGRIRLRRQQEITGEGQLHLKDGRWSSISLQEATVDFDVKRSVVELKTAKLQTASAWVDLKGKASWIPPRPQEAIGTVRLELNGGASAPGPQPKWSLPIEGRGELHPSEHWHGTATLVSRAVVIGEQTKETARIALDWDDHHLTWNEGRWGHWLTHGSLTSSQGGTSLSGEVRARRVPMELLSRWLWPHAATPAQGFLSGQLQLGGTLAAPTANFTSRIEQGRWRAFLFTSDLSGQWSPKGWQPLAVRSMLASGGNVQFQGTYDVGGQAHGLLKVSDLALQPFTESFSLPKPLKGKAGATLTVRGPLDRLEFTGHFEGGPVEYGMKRPLKLENVALDASLAPSRDSNGAWRLTVTEGLAKTAEEQVRLRQGSFIDFGGEPSRLQIGAELRNVHLGLFTLFGGLDLTGTWQLKTDGPSLQADTYTRSLFINDYELEEGRLLAEYYNGHVTFKAPSKRPALVSGSINFEQAPQLLFDRFFISGKDRVGLELDGEVGPTRWNFHLAGKSLDIGTLSGLAGFPYPLSGTADLTVRGTGDLQTPHLEGSLHLREGRTLGLGYRTGSSDFIWQGNRITFTHLTLSDPGRYTLTGAGVFPLSTAGRASDRTIDFSVRLQDSNLGFLQSISSEVKQAKGAVQGILQITGTSQEPILHGSFKVANGDVVGAHYFRHLQDFQLDAQFENGDLVVRELRGRSGNGTVAIKGKIGFVGFKPGNYDLQGDVVSPKGIDVQVPELAIPESPLAKRFQFLTTASRCDVQGHVTFKGSAEAPLFAGEATFTNGHFTFPPSRKNPPPQGFVEWIRLVNWDVALKFQDGAFFENELVEASLVGQLKLRGPSERLRVDGGIDINEGKISYLGVQFDINQARYDIRSDDSGTTVVNTPYVRGIAESQVQAINTVSGVGLDDPASRLQDKDTVTLTIDYAPVDQIKPRLASRYNPNMTQDKLLARVTQLDAEHLTPQERNYLYQQQMVSLIDNSLATPLAKNILKRTGLVDNFRVSRVIDPSSAPLPEQTPGTATQPQTNITILANTKYTFEKNLGSRLSLGYGLRFVEDTAPDAIQSKLDLVNDVELSYRWFRNVYLRGTFDLPNSNPAILPERKVTIEPRWRFGWWGNTNKPKSKAAPAPSTPSNP